MLNYSERTAQELREMLLNNTIDVDLMSIEDYERLFDLEVSLKEPDVVVLSFCNKGLKQFDKYDVGIQKPPFEAIRRKQSKRNFKLVNKIARQAATIILVLAVVAILAQGIAYALGFNLFGYIYNWFKDSDAVIITTDGLDEDGEHDLRNPENTITSSEVGDNTDEFVNIDYGSIDEIDEAWLRLVSPYLLSEFEFVYADYYRHFDEEKFGIYFFDKNQKLLYLTIKSRYMLYIEREDEVFVEDFIVSNVTFKIFRNIDNLNVIWEHEDFLFNLSSFSSLDEVKNILRNYY